MIYSRSVGLVLVVSILTIVCFMALVGMASAQPIGTWTLTGSLNVARGNFPEFLVPLPDGRILAIGGFDSAVQDIASVEVYDRSTESWNFTDSLGIGRYNHSSTVLLNERILVTGGDSIVAETTAELYDPTTETFSPTGAMGTAYKRHTATRLPNGKVLVAGGVLDAPHDSADLYDPTSGTFTHYRGARLVAVYFFDSSALVKRYAQETGSEWVMATTEPQTGHTLYIRVVPF